MKKELLKKIIHKKGKKIEFAIITNLEKKYLHSIPEMAAEDPAGLSPYCRVFIDGYPLEDFDQPLDNGKPAIELEMILLLAYEGG